MGHKNVLIKGSSPASFNHEGCPYYSRTVKESNVTIIEPSRELISEIARELIFKPVFKPVHEPLFDPARESLFEPAHELIEPNFA